MLCVVRQEVQLNNHGIKLCAKEDEELERVIFDLDKNTVSVVVRNPTLPSHAPGVCDLSDAPEFYRAQNEAYKEVNGEKR